MARHAPQVFIDTKDIARIEALILRLRTGARVRLLMDNGPGMSGTVTEKPTIQIFENAHGNQGVNAMLRLDVDEVRGDSEYVWLGDIVRVDTIDTR